MSAEIIFSERSYDLLVNRMNTANQPIEYIQVEPERWTKYEAQIIVEAPVSLTVNGEVWLTFMCTPVDLEALALGFLFNEGVIQSIEEVESVRLCASGDNVDVWLNHRVEQPRQWRRTSGCTGGVTAIEADGPQPNTEDLPEIMVNGSAIHAGQIGALIEALFESQELYRQSGGVHTSALSDGQKMTVVGEDIGRHNTLDKIAGRCLLEPVEMQRRILLTTGRISSEMIQKANRLGATIVISRTSPSSLSIKLARRWGITLIGYARRNRFRVYTHPQRIIKNETSEQTELQTTEPEHPPPG
jgi:FdhD protein